MVLPFPSAWGRVINTAEHRVIFKVGVILNKEAMARVEIEKFVLGSPARGERTNLNKTLPCFQGFPWALQETPHSLAYSSDASKREHVGFPPHMKTASVSLASFSKETRRYKALKSASCSI